MKILVTGSNGQLGSELKKISPAYNYKWYFTDRKEFDFFQIDRIGSYLTKINPNLIINCFAYTSVDSAEFDEESANISNHIAVKFISKWCNYNNCKLIHLSTDYVYDDTSTIPIKEDNKTNPINNYGKSKLSGDIACFFNNPDSIILRTSWLYSSFGNNFVKKMINLMKHKEQLYVVSDQIGSPTNAADLANVIMHIINSKKWRPGVYNYANKGAISRFELANNIKEICGFDTTINDIKTDQFQTKASRPKYTVLDTTKISNIYNVVPIPYMDSLKKCIKLLKNE